MLFRLGLRCAYFGRALSCLLGTIALNGGYMHVADFSLLEKLGKA